jgi:hypothetical protein
VSVCVREREKRECVREREKREKEEQRLKEKMFLHMFYRPIFEVLVVEMTTNFESCLSKSTVTSLLQK